MVVGIFGAAYILVSCVGAKGVGDLASVFVAAGGVGDLEALGVGDLEALGVEDIAGPFWWAIANLVLGVLDLDFRTVQQILAGRVLKIEEILTWIFVAVFCAGGEDVALG